MHLWSEIPVLYIKKLSKSIGKRDCRSQNDHNEGVLDSESPSDSLEAEDLEDLSQAPEEGAQRFLHCLHCVLHLHADPLPLHPAGGHLPHPPQPID
jgi:hypothetical protein